MKWISKAMRNNGIIFDKYKLPHMPHANTSSSTVNNNQFAFISLFCFEFRIFFNVFRLKCINVCASYHSNATIAKQIVAMEMLINELNKAVRA